VDGMRQALLRRPLAVALVATVGVLIGAGVANAAPHWYSNGKLLKEGAVEPVATGGVLTFAVLNNSPSIKATCHVRDHGTVTNPVGGSAGTGELTAFSLSKCVAATAPCPSGTTIEIIAHKLPWLTRLIPGPPIRDVIEGIELEVTCSGATPFFRDPFRGDLMPTVGNSVLEFGAGSGELMDPANRKATVTGTDKLNGQQEDQNGQQEGENGPPAAEKITAKDP
jgi:hypothetical protein